MTQTTTLDRFKQIVIQEAIKRGHCPQCAQTWLITFEDGLVYCPECDFEATVIVDTETPQNEDAK